MFNGTAILLSLVGGIIEWRRPGHAIGRLMMLAGPTVRVRLGGLDHGRPAPTTHRPHGLPGVQLGACYLLSWPAMALIIGWIPLLFPTGTLPGPRWRVPAAVVLTLLGVGLIALALRPGESSRGLAT